MDNPNLDIEWPKTFSGNVALYLTGGMHFAVYNYLPFALGYFAISTITRLIAGTDKSNTRPIRRAKLLTVLQEIFKTWSQSIAGFQYQCNALMSQYPPEMHPMIFEQLLQHFESSVRSQDAAILEQHNVTADAVKLSIQKYRGDAKIETLVGNIRAAVNSIFVPKKDVDRFTPEDAVRIVGEILEASIQTMEDVYMQLSNGKYIDTADLSPEFITTLNAKYATEYSNVKDRLMKKLGVDQETIAALANKFQSNDVFTKMIQLHYASKKRRFNALGVATAD